MSQAAQSPSPQVAWILYAAMWASTVVYLVVLWMQRGSFAERSELEPAVLVSMAVVGVGSAVASFLLPRHLHRMGLTRTELAIEEVPDPDASVMFRDQTPTIRVFAEPEEARRCARQLFFTPFILRLALAESVALYGVVIGLSFSAGWETILPFFVVTWAIFSVSAPLDARIYGPLEEAQGARLLEPR